MSQMITTVCISALALLLLRMLVPEGKLSGQMGLLIAAVFLLTGLSAAKGALPDMDVSGYSYESSGAYISFSGEVNRELQERICTSMRDEIRGILAEEGLTAKEIRVIVNISGLYSISISRVELVFEDERSAIKAGELLSEELDSVEVITMVG